MQSPPDLPDLACDAILAIFQAENHGNSYSSFSCAFKSAQLAQRWILRQQTTFELRGQPSPGLMDQHLHNRWRTLRSLTILQPDAGIQKRAHLRGNAVSVLPDVVASAKAAAAAADPKSPLPLHTLSLPGCLWDVGALKDLPRLFPGLQRGEFCFPNPYKDYDLRSDDQLELAMQYVAQLTGLTALVLQTKDGENCLRVELPVTLVSLAWESDYMPYRLLTHLTGLKHLHMREKTMEAMTPWGIKKLTQVDMLSLSAFYYDTDWFEPDMLHYLAPRLVDMELCQLDSRDLAPLTRVNQLTRLTALRFPHALQLQRQLRRPGGPKYHCRSVRPAGATFLEELATSLRQLPSLQHLTLHGGKASKPHGGGTLEQHPLLAVLSQCASLRQLSLVDAHYEALQHPTAHLSNISGLTRLHLASASCTGAKWHLILSPLTGLVFLEVEPRMLFSGPQPHDWLSGFTRLRTLALTHQWQLCPKVPKGQELPPRAGPDMAKVAVVLRGLPPNVWRLLLVGYNHWPVVDEVEAAVPEGVEVVCEHCTNWWRRVTRPY